MVEANTDSEVVTSRIRRETRVAREEKAREQASATPGLQATSSAAPGGALAVETMPPPAPPPPPDPDKAFRRGRIGIVAAIVLVLLWLWIRERKARA